MMNPVDEYCNSMDCKSKIKILRTMKDIKNYHSDHGVQVKTFQELSIELQKDDHPLRNLKMSLDKEQLDTFIEEEIIKLSKSFEQVLKGIKSELKSFVSSHVQSLTDLVDLYNAVIEKNDSKIEELQYAIPCLSITSDVIEDQEEMAREVQREIEKVLKGIRDQIKAILEVDLNIPTFVQSTFAQTVQVQSNSLQQIPNQGAEQYKWSTTLKHPDAMISGKIFKNDANAHHMVMLEPQLSMNEVSRVQIKIKKLGWVMISLCDINVAKNIKPTWDKRNNVGEGTYSQYNGGAIYPHHLATNQKNGQVLAFRFKEGDVLELEWDGSSKQFQISRPSSNDKYIQNVQFGQNAVLHFGVQLHISSVVELV